MSDGPRPGWQRPVRTEQAFVSMRPVIGVCLRCGRSLTYQPLSYLKETCWCGAQEGSEPYIRKETVLAFLQHVTGNDMTLRLERFVAEQPIVPALDLLAKRQASG